jgi:DNA (cytosine-5)-methyltransferase 1
MFQDFERENINPMYYTVQNNSQIMKHKAISLFTGAGGMDVGFTSAGFNVVWANEFVKHAAETYKSNHPNTNIVVGDINAHIDEIPVNDIDCVFGGPPCQGFSVAGKMDINDPRSQLVFSFMQVVAKVKPNCFVMENVKALAKLEKFSNIREELYKKADALGYKADFFLLNSKNFGVPQARERVFFIGFKKELKKNINYENFIIKQKNEIKVKDIFLKLGKASTDDNPLTCKAKITIAEKPILRKSPYAGMLFNGMGRPIKLDGVANTLPASMGGNKTPIVDEGFLFDGKENWIENYHNAVFYNKEIPKFGDAPSQLRRITIKEAALIQTFPEEYKFAGPISSQYTQIGNAVPCKLAEAVAGVVIDILRGNAIEYKKTQNELQFID